MFVDRAIDRFCTGAEAPEYWPTLLDEVARDLGAEGATLSVGITGPNHTIASTTIMPLLELYFDGPITFDTREEKVRPTLASGFLGDFDCFTAEEIARDPFYQDFLRPHGMGWHASAALTDGPRPVVLSLKRLQACGPYQADELAQLSDALPYLRAGARAAQAMMAGRADSWIDALRMMGRGAILLDGEGRMMAGDAAGLFGDGLTTRGGRLTAAAPHDQARLDAVLGQALMPGPITERPPQLPVAIHRPSGRKPLILRIHPFSGNMANPLAGVRVLVEILDPERIRLPAPELLQHMFGLTRREAELAIALGAERDLRDVADRLGITPTHARQRLKVIFQKTETARQSELIALLHRLG